MNFSLRRIKKIVELIEQEGESVDKLASNLQQSSCSEMGSSIPMKESYGVEGQQARLDFIESQRALSLDALRGQKVFTELDSLKGNIEHYIGMTQVPTGIIGPLKVKGIYASGDYYLPLATTEGALVASYHRGVKACSISGGVTSVFMAEGVQRSPLFKFKNIPQAGKFAIWVAEQLEQLKKITSESSRYAQLQNMDTKIQGNEVILTFEYSTGDAAGQNMVTICTQAICEFLLLAAPVKPVHWYIESNYSGDKKANAVAFSRVRGKKVTAEVVVPEAIVNQILRSTPQKMANYWQSSTVAVLQSSSIGAQGHFANGLAALFLACGQDVACVSEAAVGITRMEVNQAGDLYASVTVPNLIIGTVGGGTFLPTQAECLKIMDCYGSGNSRKFAEICAAMLLGGELSIAAALSSGHFTHAHQQFGRKKS